MCGVNEVPDPEELIEITPGPAPPAGPGRHDPYAALRCREYLLYAIGNLFSAIASSMQAVAIGWELYDRTGSALALGWVGLVQAFPIVLFALPAGQLADRFDRRRLVVLGQGLTVLCSLGLAALSYTRGPVPAVYGLLFLSALARAVHWPASSALMPQLMPRAVFSNAVTWRSTAFQVASVAGPALGGLLIACYEKPAVVYAATAALTLVNCLLVSRIKVQPVSRTSEPASVDSLLAGIGFVWRTKPVLAAITLDLFAVLLGGATALLPIYAKDILRVGPTGLGWLRAAPAFGAFVMAMVIAHRPPWPRPGRALLWAVAGFGLVMIGFGWSRWFWFSMVMLVVSGALDNISVVIRHSLVQLSTPDAMRGRVSAVNAVFISCSNELGEFESGFVAAGFGPVASAVSGGVGTILVVLVVSRVWPQIRHLRAWDAAAATPTAKSSNGAP